LVYLYYTTLSNKRGALQKCFISGGKYYYYDYLGNYIYRVSKAHYRELETLSRVGFDEYRSQNLGTPEYNDICRLIRAHRINGETLTAAEHFNANDFEEICDRCVGKLQLQVTRNCNFNCRYCVYTRQSGIGRSHEAVNMTWDTARAAVDFLYEHSADSEEIYISFYGGEPFMNFNLIEKTVEYAKSRFLYKQINFSTITNCSIMTPHIIDFLAENDFVLIISFDGDSDIQNRHRSFMQNGADSYDNVYQNVKMITDRNAEFFKWNVKFNSVKFVDEESERVYGYFSEEFSKPKDFVNIINADLHGIDYDPSVYNTPYRAGEYVYDDPEHELESFRSVYGDKRYINERWLYGANCIPGAQHLLVNVFGDFYPCEKVPEVEDARVGNISDGFIPDSVKKLLNIHQISLDDCKKCWAVRFCKMCVCHCIDPVTGKLSLKVKRKNCNETKREVLDMLKKIAEESADGE
ncbi:MAG: radical SAM protein, partial [Clostridia bacterium]|nr:radical SAM protein [Clostridia bacterium]